MKTARGFYGLHHSGKLCKMTLKMTAFHHNWVLYTRFPVLDLLSCVLSRRMTFSRECTMRIKVKSSMHLIFSQDENKTAD